MTAEMTSYCQSALERKCLHNLFWMDSAFYSDKKLLQVLQVTASKILVQLPEVYLDCMQLQTWIGDMYILNKILYIIQTIRRRIGTCTFKIVH